MPATPDTTSNRTRWILSVAAVCGLCSIYFLAVLSTETVIPASVIFRIFALLTISGYLLLKFTPLLKNVSKKDRSGLGGHIILSIMLFAIPGCTAFLLINKQFAAPQQFHTYARITDKNLVSRKGYNSNGEKYKEYDVSFLMGGQIEQTSFNEVFHAEVDAATHLDVTCKKGLFGYPVMTAYKLK